MRAGDFARRRAVLGTLALWVLALAACGGSGGEVVRVTIPRGSGLSAAADTLAAHDVIDWPTGFRIYARVKGADRTLKPGVYDLRKGSSWDAALGKLVSGDVVKVKVAVPEGWTAREIAARLAQVTGTPQDVVQILLMDSASATRYGVPGPTLEGYLYPATYTFPLGTPLPQMVRTMTRRYREVWTPAMRARADSLGMSEREVVTLASIVEKEAKVWDERDEISAVYHNRLRIGMPLQADPTVQYALGEHQARLLYKHISDVRDHPYNTYRRRGLPPGPIASPSKGAIQAALRPARVEHLYFVARPDGRHVFTRTLAEHNAAKRASQRARGRSPRAVTPAELAARLSLIVITDAECAAGRGLVEVVRAALVGGAPAVQLRAKTEPARETVELARALREETRAAGALLFVNDRVDVALAAGADGAHLGDDDLPLAAARSIAPPGFLLGRSADTPEDALRARREGADYLGVGPVYATATKADAGVPIGLERISLVSRAVDVPVVGIGGIGADNAAEVVRAGAAGVAVIRAIMAAPDPELATREILRRISASTASGGGS